MKNTALTIISGPCSVDQNNLREIYQIAAIKAKGKRAIAGTRVVGLKSRSEYQADTNYIGMDHDAVMENIGILLNGGSTHELNMLPSITIGEQINADTDLIIASEIMVPQAQLPLYHGKLRGKLLPWLPAVNQLGWTVMEMASYAGKNDWQIGIKNGKWIGEEYSKVEDPSFIGANPLVKVWSGLASYAQSQTKDVILIHRGVDIPEKGDFRNALVHNTAMKTKLASGAKLYFDPSHSYGPKMRHAIIAGTIAAMKMKINANEYLYDGILIEAGTSQTDTEQHITLIELQQLVNELAAFRNLQSPESSEAVAEAVMIDGRWNLNSSL